MIPKIIHYCWFGDDSLPEEYQQYIDRWAELHKGWNLFRWDEKDLPTDIPYLNNAVKNKKWANVSNLMRLYVLLKHGGIYLDTDIKVIKPLTPLLKNDCFLGFESDNQDEFWVNNAVLGAIPEHKFVRDCYEQIQDDFDGTEEANLSAPVLTTNILRIKWGLKEYGIQKVGDIQLYPINYFYPVKGYESFKAKKTDTQLPEEAYTVHMWGRSWYSREMFIRDIEVLQEYTNDLSKLTGEKDNEIANLQKNGTSLANILAEKQLDVEKLEADRNNLFKVVPKISDVIEKKTESLVSIFKTQFSTYSKYAEDKYINSEEFRIFSSTIASDFEKINNGSQLIEKKCIELNEKVTGFLLRFSLLEDNIHKGNIHNDLLEGNFHQLVENSAEQGATISKLLNLVNSEVENIALIKEQGEEVKNFILRIENSISSKINKIEYSFTSAIVFYEKQLTVVDRIIKELQKEISGLVERFDRYETLLNSNFKKTGEDLDLLLKSNEDLNIISKENADKQNVEIQLLRGAIQSLSDQVNSLNSSVQKKDKMVDTLINDIRFYQQKISFYEKNYENQSLFRVMMNHLTKKGKNSRTNDR